MAKKSATYSTGEDANPVRELRGIVERVTYQNPENGYTVARLAPERGTEAEPAPRDADNLVTIVGAMLDLTPGEAVVLQGWWNLDHKYGWQFKVKDYRTTLPATIQGMRRYLGSGLIKGLGPVYAGRIVEVFGEQTFEIIDVDPRRLTEVDGIGPIRAERIATTWAEQRQIREVMTGLHSYGVSTSLAVRIYKKFGEQSARIVAEEPYRLAREVWGIGFKTADKIAGLVGIAPDAPARLQAGVLHALGTAAEDGHTLLPRDDLVLRATDLLGAEPALIYEAIDVLLETGELIRGQRVASSMGSVADAALSGSFSLREKAGEHASGSLSRGEKDWEQASGSLSLGERVRVRANEAHGSSAPMEDRGPHPNPLPQGEGTRGALPGGEGARGALLGREGTRGASSGEKGGGGGAPTVSDEEKAPPLIALAPFARAESGLASRLRALAAAGERGPSGTATGRVFGSVDWEVALRWLEERHGLALAPEQRQAVRMALTAPVSILTGGPGTGKTHSLRAVLALARAKQLRVVLAAPTGRAAKRMEEATGAPAATLHRALELRPGGKSTRGPDNPLEADLVVVDEVSMLDALLANQLVKAVPPGAHLLLVGDPDQLPSVGAGNVLSDLLASGQFPVTRLEHIFRQGEGSGIAANAQRIRSGQVPRFGREIPDCFFLPSDDPAEVADLVVDLVTRRLPARYGFAKGEVQTLVPMHRGVAGVGALNLLLQERLNPGREGVPEARSGGRVFRPGDRVLQLKNDYDLGVFNGDLGTVRQVDPDEAELLVGLDDGREVHYPFASLYSLAHAYSLSVHKSQGAEFPAVVLPLVTSYAMLLGRTLLYTAFTRAKRLVVCVGQEKALRMAVKDWRRTERRTALGGLLDGTLDFTWPRKTTSASPTDLEDDASAWEGLLESDERVVGGLSGE